MKFIVFILPFLLFVCIQNNIQREHFVLKFIISGRQIQINMPAKIGGNLPRLWNRNYDFFIIGREIQCFVNRQIVETIYEFSLVGFGVNSVLAI